MSILKALKTFDIFNRETIRFLTDKVVNIFLVETNNKKLNGIDVNVEKNQINVNILNKPKAYKLLVSAQRRLEQKKQNLKNENNKCQIS